MDLSDALGDWPGGNQNQSGGAWPGQPSNPVWPGAPSQPSAPGAWPGAPTQPAWPGAPAQPAWPGGPSQPAWPGAPSQPSQPGQPAAPGGWPSPAPGPAPGPGFPVAPQMNLTIPFKQDFPNGLQDKRLITIAGTINPNANKFTIDFCTASDLVFHFNPRFNEGGRRVIVRNSEIGKQWGKEERDAPGFPFAPGQSFEMKILVTAACFKVAVNNSHLLEFKHRMGNLRAINRMNIYYDLTLSKVTVEDLP